MELCPRRCGQPMRLDFGVVRLWTSLSIMIGLGSEVPTGQKTVSYQIPSSIVGLTELQLLIVECSYGVSLTGALPSQLIDGTLRKLSLVSFTGCDGLTGDVSAWNLSRSNLTSLLLAENSFYGDVSNLQCNHGLTISLASNKLTGTVPWQGCICAYDMDLSFNQLTTLGTAAYQPCLGAAFDDPYTPGRRLDLRGNGMTGQVTDIETIFTYYESINMGSNAISGTLPVSMWTYPFTFTFINLATNQLTGTIPDATVERFSNSSLSCMFVSLTRNQLTGTVPLVPPYSCISLEAEDNLLTGFNGDDDALQGYLTLQVPRNRLTGMLPRNLPKTGLVDLDVSDNMLTGCPFAPVSCTHPVHNTSIYSSPTLGSSTSTPDITSTPEAPETIKLMRLSNNMFSCPIGTCPPVWATDTLQVTSLEISGGDYANVDLSLIPSQVIMASNCNLQGRFMISPSTTTAFLSYNHFNGSLPSLEGRISSSSIGPQVLQLDLSYNDFTGGIIVSTTDDSSSLEDVSSFSKSINLATLNMTGNAVSEFASNIAFISSEEVAFVGADFTCPALQIASGSTIVYTSPDFYAYERCTCNSLFFGGVVPGGFNCTSLSAICDELVCFDLENTTSSHITVLKGYFPRPSFNASTSMVACPLIMPSKTTYACGGHCSCVGNVGSLSCDCSSVCSRGYEDLFCSRCSQGYFAVGLLCFECNTAANGAAVGIAAACLALSVAGMVWSSGMPQQRATGDCCPWLRQNKVMSAIVFIELVSMTIVYFVMNVANVGVIGVSVLLALLLQLAWHQAGPASDPSRKPVDLRALTILITFLQTIAAAVPSGFWTFEAHSGPLQAFTTLPPWQVYSASGARAIAQLNPFGVECYIDTNQIEVLFYWTLIAPFFVNGLILCGLGLWRLRLLVSRGSTEQATAIMIRARTAMLFVINYLIFNAFVIVIQLFNCGTSGGEEAFLVSHPWFQCFSPQWYQLLAVALAVIVGYVGVVVIFAWFMRKTVKNEGVDVMRSRFSFFVSPFRETHWWFGLVILARRLILAVGLSGFPSASSTGPLMVLGALVAGLVAQTTAWPYSHPALNWIETSQLAILIVTYAAVVLLNAGLVTFSISTRVILSLVNIIFVVVAIVYTISPTLRRIFVKPRRYEELSADPSETSTLRDHWSASAQATESVRVRDLEEENANLHRRVATLESENASLNRRLNVAQ